MTHAKRPKLGAVLRGEGTSAPTAVPPRVQPPPEPITVPTDKMVQLNVTVTEELRRSVRIRALQQGVDVGVIVRQLLQNWLSE